MSLVTLSEAPAIDNNNGFVFRPLAVPSRGSTELAIWQLEVAPGAKSERHTVSKEEVFLLRAGSISIEVGDEAHSPAVGDAVILPPETPLLLSNPGDEPAVLTVCTSRGIEGKLNGMVIAPPWAQ
ncbi:Cupin domain-containing protein [Amycolatopsis xylanica]|uniref:Cupin domain-containing protein n=1 Tax=Amycolatopsis xylanica TaxID=589385 RepID=A0A1H3PQR3_9PSEU|nr:cupin domain-containing protein [Amycolatopsis xylanica]SDZ03348.1 Cupin domain-containing protein [Amycolatopsis xylanica]